MHTLQVQTKGRQKFEDITERVQQIVHRTGIKEGICYLFCPHTTAGLTLNENWDPDVLHDMGIVFDDLVPQRTDFRHSEGNSPAHVKSSMVSVDHSVFVSDGKLVLGTWQGIYLAEFDGPRTRKVLVKIVQE
jgi:secondary thiamine-phosphate synthase enzyme